MVRCSVPVAILSMVGPARAAGWQEVHQTADDVRIAVGRDGVATVEHHLRYRVVAGRFKSFDFAGVDGRATLTNDTVLRPEHGGEIAARVEKDAKSEGTVHVLVGEPKGLGRGVYVVDVKYTLDLVATKLLTRDGAMLRLSWTSPPARSGQDGARVVFEFPPAQTEPRLAAGDGTTTLTTTKRSAERDELELVRAHVPRGEAVTWTVRVDPKALSDVTAPDLRPPPPAVASASPPNHVPEALAAAALALVFAGLALARRAKHGFVVAASRDIAVPRPLVPLPPVASAVAYASAGVAALGSFLWGDATAGAASLVVAMALATYRMPTAKASLRGPGRFKPVPDEEVLVAPVDGSGDAFDVTTTRGRVGALAASAAIAALVMVLRSHVPFAHVVIPLAATALVPLFVTGTRAQLPASPTLAAARLLRPARDALPALVDLAHVELSCVARVRDDRGTFDEVRLVCLPARPIPGLSAIELALAGVRPGAVAALPEVLVRFEGRSETSARIATLAPGVPWGPGRTSEEKVLRLSPCVPTPHGAARLLATLLTALEQRRAVVQPPYEGLDRRTLLAATT